MLQFNSAYSIGQYAIAHLTFTDLNTFNDNSNILIRWCKYKLHYIVKVDRHNSRAILIKWYILEKSDKRLILVHFHAHEINKTM